ncbi:MAG: L-threonylcarbamoyladenylate synthase [Nitrospira sp.]|nr:L-threonylcarbamoyladenylate synthase [Nitrospira sp.]
MATVHPLSLSTLPVLAPSVRSVIQNRGLIAVPTETYYGLGTSPFDAGAVDRLLQVKNREDSKPILVLIGDIDQLPLLVANMPRVGRILAEAFWPGALTILLPAHPSLPHNLTAGSGLVGVRLSPCFPLTELLKQTGPVTGTSANRSGGPPSTTAEQVQRELGHEIDMILDAGRTPGGLPSTVVDVRDPVRLVREGAIPRQTIRNVLQTHEIALTA